MTAQQSLTEKTLFGVHAQGSCIYIILYLSLWRLGVGEAAADGPEDGEVEAAAEPERHADEKGKASDEGSLDFSAQEGTLEGAI